MQTQPYSIEVTGDHDDLMIELNGYDDLGQSHLTVVSMAHAREIAARLNAVVEELDATKRERKRPPLPSPPRNNGVCPAENSPGRRAIAVRGC